MIADKKQRFFERDFLKVRIKNAPEENPERKRRQDIFQKP
jgi:hypothetical protein